MARSHFLVVLATLWSVTACAPADIPLPTESQKERGLVCVAETTGKAATRPLTENLAVEVYVDGSGSMLGYVKGSNGEQTAYGETIELISELFEQTDGYGVSYHRIEDGGNRELTRSQYRDARTSR
ncbi:MAG: hypothetical protein HC890_19520, partial [Chloroflexaceae bacterium]|nr:hypothetical protein [Chloroflexaceae bacterium]